MTVLFMDMTVSFRLDSWFARRVVTHMALPSNFPRMTMSRSVIFVYVCSLTGIRYVHDGFLSGQAEEGQHET